MDPSFDNSLGGFSGNPNFSAGAPVGGAPAVSGSGAPVASGADAGGVTSIASGSNVGPISSGTGDIILTPSEGKKGRKGLIVGIIAGILLVGLLVGVILFFVLGGKNNSAISETEKRLNRFANFLVAGEASEGDIDPMIQSPYESYFYDVAFNEDFEKRQSFFNESQTLLDEFVSVADNESNNNLFNSLLVSMPVQFTATKSYYLANTYNSGDMVANGIEMGVGAMLNDVSDAYSGLLDSGDATVSTLAAQKISMAESAASFVEIYYNVGCVENGEVVERCSELVNQNEELGKIWEEILNQEADIAGLEVQLIRDILGDCENISSTFGVEEETFEEKEEDVE